MKKENWENKFIEKAQEHSVVPPAHIWDNVELTLERKRKRFGFPFWLLGIILAFVVGFGLVQMTHRRPCTDFQLYKRNDAFLTECRALHIFWKMKWHQVQVFYFQFILS